MYNEILILLALKGTIEEKTHQVSNNLKNILEKAGLSFENVVKTTIYVTEPLCAEVEISMIAVK